jgi:Zn-dependent protease/predicted transcriptional regulator
MPGGRGDKTLFRLFGLPIRANASWLFLVALVLMTLAQSQFPALLGPGVSWQVRWGLAVVATVGLFASLLIHEMAHSLVARATGMPVAGITLFIFGGVSQLEDEPPTAGSEFIMAVAGPASSVLLGAGAAALCVAGQVLRWPREVVALLNVLASVNFLLAAFNSLPAFPMDGGRVLRSVVWGITGNLRTATRVAVGIGSFAGLAMMAGGGLIIFYTRAFITGVWLIIIGFFLRQAGYGSLQAVVMREELEDVTVRDFMVLHVVTVPQELSIEDFVRDYVFHFRFSYYPVVDTFGRVIGLLSAHAPRELAVDFWPRTAVRTVMQPLDEAMLLHPDTPANDALSLLRRSQPQLAVVVEEGRPVGIVALGDLMKFLTLRVALTPGRRRLR